MAFNWLNAITSGLQLFTSWKSNSIQEDYYNAQMQSQAEQNQLNYESYKLEVEKLGLEYQNTLNNLKSTKLDIENSRLNYQEAMESTELSIQNLISGEGGIEYYDALLARWQDNYDYQMASTKMQAQETYNSLVSNYTGTEVMNAEAGRGGKTAELLERQQKQNLEAYVGKDLKLDAIGGVYSQTLTELEKDLNADKHTYMTQLGILGKSLASQKETLNDYRTNLDEIDTEIEKYNAQIQAYEDILNGKTNSILEDDVEAISSTEAGGSTTPSTTYDKSSESITDINTDFDSIISGEESNNHVGETSYDWTDYTFSNKNILKNLKYITNNSDNVTLETLDTSSLGDGWQGFKATDKESGEVISIYRDADGRYIQVAKNDDGELTYRLTTTDGEGLTVKADDLAEATKKLENLDKYGDVAKIAADLALGTLTGGVSLIGDLLFEAGSSIVNKVKDSNFNSVYDSIQSEVTNNLMSKFEVWNETLPVSTETATQVKSDIQGTTVNGVTSSYKTLEERVSAQINSSKTSNKIANEIEKATENSTSFDFTAPKTTTETTKTNFSSIVDSTLKKATEETTAAIKESSTKSEQAKDVSADSARAEKLAIKRSSK